MLETIILNRGARNAVLLRSCVILAGSGLLLASPAYGLTINLTYDSTVAALPYASSAESATQYAAQQIENLFSDNMTININVVASPNAFGGSGYSYSFSSSYAAIRSDLIATATTPTDATAYASLPLSPDPTGGGNFLIPTVEEKALGLIPANSTGNDGTFTFGSNVNWTFDPNNRAISGESDFIGVAEHEITEIMGRNLSLNQGSPPLYRPVDLFRYSAPGVRNFNPNATNTYFSIDGGVTDLMDYPTGTEGDWAPGLTDAFDAASVQGTENDITPTDIAILDVMGYHAVTTHILNSLAGGNWNSPANWNTSNVPAAGDGAYLTYGDGVSRTITYNYTGPAVTLYSVTLDLAGVTGTATTTLSMSANNLTVSGFEIVARNGSGVFNQSGGNNTINGENGLFIGYNPGSNGSYSLSGTGCLTVNANESVGYSGNGTFTQTGGTNSITAGDGLFIGNNAGSTGTYSLSGSGSLITSRDEHVGNSGNGTFTQTGGTNSITSGSWLYIANNTGSIGTYTLSASASLIASGNEQVGNNGNGTFTQTGGTNTISFDLQIGSQPGATGNFTLSGNASLSTGGWEYVGFFGQGAFTQTGGNNTVSADLDVSSRDGASGNYSLGGTGFLQVNSNEYAGYLGTGIFNQTAGINQIALNLGIGFNDSAANGTYTLQGGTLSVGAYEYVGYFGTGTFTQTAGNHTIGADLDLGTGGGSSGNYTLSGTGSLSVTGSEYIGYFGNGNFTQSGGSNSVNGILLIAANSGATGNYSLQAGTLTAASIVVNPGGSFSQTGGTLSFTSLQILGGNTSFHAVTTKLSALSFTGFTNHWSGQLDITNSKLIIEDTSSTRAADLANLKNQALTSNIQSSSANAANAAAGKIIMSLVVSDNTVRLATFPSGSTNFGGTNNVDAHSILITAAFKGDANLDGVVDIQDLTDVANHWQQSVTDWSQGDFDNSNFVDIQDLTAVANNWQAGVGGGGAGGGQSFNDALAQISNFKPAAIPEPASLALLTFGATLLRRRRRLIPR